MLPKHNQQKAPFHPQIPGKNVMLSAKFTNSTIIMQGRGLSEHEITRDLPSGVGHDRKADGRWLHQAVANVCGMRDKLLGSMKWAPIPFNFNSYTFGVVLYGVCRVRSDLYNAEKWNTDQQRQANQPLIRVIPNSLKMMSLSLAQLPLKILCAEQV